MVSPLGGFGLNSGMWCDAACASFEHQHGQLTSIVDRPHIYTHSRSIASGCIAAL